MYTWDGRIRFSEVGEDKKITLGNVLNYFQDCSTFQSEDIGNGIDVLNKLHRVWVLSSWQIVVNRYPKLGEKITVGTWPYDFKRFLGSRNFVMKGEDGEVFAYANSLWTYLNTENGRPARVDEEVVSLYGLEPKFEMDYADRKIELPEEMTAEESFPVERHHLDTNHHVNNGQYVQMAEMYLPEGFLVAQMRAEYKKSALPGDRICPKVYADEAKVVVSLDDEQGNPFTIVEFQQTVEGTSGGELQPEESR